VSFRPEQRGQPAPFDLLANGCGEVTWLFPEETGFYQPIVIAKK